MKFLSATAFGVLVATLGLVAPVQAAECTQDELLKFGTTALAVMQKGECAKVTVTGKEPTAKDVCKVPGCVATIKASLNEWPDCSIDGENVRARFTSLSQCGGSSSSAASAGTTAVAGVIVLVSTVAAVIA
ncbi:hypothetical protein P43SY_000477 [Pythium insidiosum]|uniref:Elicitin-like protein n=1 Tax=Pythium insidiosum TaxID=114742 RepID=A0AAD5LM68_PYTIN|nr:hypothetical protein P43SY_000477 [Pythium insidiosum]